MSEMTFKIQLTVLHLGGFTLIIKLMDNFTSWYLLSIDSESDILYTTLSVDSQLTGNKSMRVYIIFIWLLLTGITKWEVQTTLRYFLFHLQEMETTTENHSQPKCEVVHIYKEAGHIYTASPTPTLRGHWRRRVKRLKEQENRGVCCEIVSPWKVRI